MLQLIEGHTVNLIESKFHDPKFWGSTTGFQFLANKQISMKKKIGNISVR